MRTEAAGTPSAFQQAICKAFTSFLLGHTARLSYEKHDGFEDGLWASAPCWQLGPCGEDGASTVRRPWGQVSAGDR
jgi:hypothetical protein